MKLLIAISVFPVLMFGQSFSIEPSIDTTEEVVSRIADFVYSFSDDINLKEWVDTSKNGFEYSIIQGIQKSYLKNKNSVAIELMNLYPIDSNRYHFQLGLRSPLDRSVLEVLIRLEISKIESWKCKTLLDYNTQHWKVQNVNEVTYLYPDTINEGRAIRFTDNNRLFAHRFDLPVSNLRFYMVRDFQEMLRIIGIDYDRTHVGKYRDGYGVVDKTIFSTMNHEDFSHDLFHYYSNQALPNAKHNWVSEEGFAYSWGDAYYTKITDGSMTTQKELVAHLKRLVEDLGHSPKWNILFEKHFWRDRTGIFDNLAPDYKVGRLIASLICDEVYAQHGISGAKALLLANKDQDMFSSFYIEIEALLGWKRHEFNQNFDILFEKACKNL